MDRWARVPSQRGFVHTTSARTVLQTTGLGTLPETLRSVCDSETSLRSRVFAVIWFISDTVLHVGVHERRGGPPEPDQ